MSPAGPEESPGETPAAGGGRPGRESGEAAAPHPRVEGRPDERPAFLWAEVGATATAIALRPEATFARFRWDGGLGRPLLFATVLGGPCAALHHVATTALLRGRLQGEVTPAVFLALVFLAPPLYLYLRAQVVHLVLVLRGGARRSFETTFRAVAYAEGAVAPAWLVPGAGGFLFLAWGTVTEAQALRAAHDLRLGQALGAILVPVVALTAAALARALVEVLVGP